MLKALLVAALVAIRLDSVAAEIGENDRNVRAVAALQRELTADLMALPNVLGTAIGVSDNGEVSFVIYVEEGGQNTAALVNGIPPRLRGQAVTVQLTDRIRSFARPGGGGGGSTVSHTAKQTGAIKLGTSGGWGDDLANGYCCGGTLGSLIEAGGVQYILSNYHVLEADISPGSNGAIATTGNPIIQPGLIDVNCTASDAQQVASLVTIHSLPNSNVDAGIAQVVPGMVSPTGEILQIGAISKNIVAPLLNKAVKKAGRTSALTKSKITGLNASVSVTYENECAGTTAFTKTFTGQIIISNKGQSFLRGGDSGSLMVEDVATNPGAIGLLFAGSNSLAVANPIGQVLNYISQELSTQLGTPVTASMVGN